MEIRSCLFGAEGLAVCSTWCSAGLGVVLDQTGVWRVDEGAQ